MSTLETNLAPQHTWEIPVTIPGPGVLKLRIASNGPVDSFVVDPVNRVSYRNGQQFSSWSPTHQSQLHSKDVTMQYAGQWFVLVRSQLAAPVQVQADITFIPFSWVLCVSFRRVP